MNKLLIITVGTFIVIGLILFSAAVIPANKSKDGTGSSGKFTSIADPASRQDFANIQQTVIRLQNDLTNLTTRVGNVEQLQRQFADRDRGTTPSQPQTQSQGTTKDVGCNIQNYLDENGRVISENELDYSTLSRDLASGKKKMTLVCTFNQ